MIWQRPSGEKGIHIRKRFSYEEVYFVYIDVSGGGMWYMKESTVCARRNKNRQCLCGEIG